MWVRSRSIVCLVLIAAIVGGQRASADDASAAGHAESVGSRELLRLYGIDQSHFEHLVDGEPWSESENEILLKILFRLKDFRPGQIEQWAHEGVKPSQLAEDPDGWRGEIFHFFGRVVSAGRLEPLPEVAERFELSDYYRCECVLEGQDPRSVGTLRAVVFARTIPNTWKTGQPIDEPAGAFGIFLKLGSAEHGGAPAYFAAPRVAWYPPTALGKLGMDVGLFDDLAPRGSNAAEPSSPEAASKRSLDDLRLTRRNRECFYQMLAAVGRAAPGQLLAEANEQLCRSGQETFSVVPLFNQPTEQHGRLVTLSGNAREVLLVRVDDEDIRARFGIDHYYQVFLFTDDSQGNPLAFCVRELPPGMPTGGGPQFGEYVTVAGFFFNTWAYQSRKPPEPSENGSQWQLAPLLIGRELVWHPRQQPAEHPLPGLIAGGVFVLVLLGVWLALWRYGHSDKRFYQETIARHLEPDPGHTWTGLDAPDAPDLSSLDQADRRDQGSSE